MKKFDVSEDYKSSAYLLTLVLERFLLVVVTIEKTGSVPRKR